MRTTHGIRCFAVLAVGLLAAPLAPAQDRQTASLNLQTMRTLGKCTVELVGAPIEFFHETFDGNHASGFAVDASRDCELSVHFVNPLTVVGFRASFFAAEDLGGVDWKVYQADQVDQPAERQAVALEHRTTLIQKPDTAMLPQPVKLQHFRFRFTKLDKELKAAAAGKKNFRIGELEVLVPPGDVVYIATPKQKWLFEPGFYPFEVRTGRTVEWTGWRIAPDGARQQTVEGVRFTSSDPAVADMNGAVMRAKAAGKTTIRAQTSDGLMHEVPVVVRESGRKGFDLDVIRIQRAVRNAAGEWEVLSRRAEKNVPAPGDKVRYRATVINLGIDDAMTMHGVWSIDGQEVKKEDLPNLEPAGDLVGSGEYLTPEKTEEILKHQHEATFDVETVWQPQTQQIRFEIQAEAESSRTGDVNPDNNAMTIASDALCFSYYTIELGYHRFTNAQQEGLKAGGVPKEVQEKVAKSWGQRSHFWRAEPAKLSSSIYDYIYRTCRGWDDQCAISTYPLTPNGITESFRSKVVIIRDPAPEQNTWGEGGGRAVWSDTEADVCWGWIAHRDFPWDQCMTAAFVRKNYTECGFMFFDAPMMHEASHAHGLVDLYICPMKNDEVMWRGADGQFLWPRDRQGAYDMTIRWTRVGHLLGKPGMMVGDYVNGYEEHTAAAMQRMARKRGRFYPCNNCSGNISFGEFFNDVAEHNVLELWTVDGKPVGGAKVEVAKREDKSGLCHEQPDVAVVTDDQGQGDLGDNPVDWPENTPPPPADPELRKLFYGLHHRGSAGSDHSAIRLTTADGKRFYKFLNAFDLNLALWYADGLAPSGWPVPKLRPGTRVVLAFTIDPKWNEAEAVKGSNEVPTFGVELPWEGKQRPDYDRIQAWRAARDAGHATGGKD
jgi:hypothetical protein